MAAVKKSQSRVVLDARGIGGQTVAHDTAQLALNDFLGTLISFINNAPFERLRLKAYDESGNLMVEANVEAHRARFPKEPKTT